MSEQSRKGSLPVGWTVHVSSKYPNKVYYFNTITGDSTWECPKLNPPRASSDNEDNDDSNMWQKNLKQDSKSTEEKPPEFKDDISQKLLIMPTAVVAPVVQKTKKSNSPLLVSEKKQVKFKRKSHDSDEDFPAIKIQRRDDKMSPGDKKNKHISPLDKFHSKEDPQDLNEDVETPSIEMSEEEIGKDACLESPENESSIKDVEIRDVSEDILDDLSEKKETLFDTTANSFIVIDTNVWVDDLKLIKKLKDLEDFHGFGPPTIYIPWTVVEELDKLKAKKGYKASVPAIEAIGFMHEELASPSSRFIGQNPLENETIKMELFKKNNDNKILYCCIILRKTYPSAHIVILTNDRNMSNKAMMLKQKVYSYESIIKELGSNFINWEEYAERRRKKIKEMEAIVSKDMPQTDEHAATSTSERTTNVEDVDRDIQNSLDDMLTVVNHLVGMVLHHYTKCEEFGHFDYSKQYSDFTFNHIIFILTPALKKIRSDLQQLIESFERKKTIKGGCKSFVETLSKFISSLNLPYKSKYYPLCNSKNFVKWIRKSENREKLEPVREQLDFYQLKLTEVISIVMNK